MSTLYKIRENQKKNKQYLDSLSETYQNPFAIDILSSMIKLQNKHIIKEICNEYQLSETNNSHICNKLLKPNFYTPTIVNSEKKELMQLYL
jgi:hypothetical protein